MSKIENTIGRSEIYKVDPKMIVVAPEWNPRQNWGDLDGLSISIEHSGVKYPLVVKKRKEDNKFELVDGERRHRATMLAIERGVEIVSIPCFIKPENYSQAEALVDTCLGTLGEPFDAVSECEVYRRFIAWGWTMESIGQRVGKSTAHISNRLKLAAAEPELIAAVQSGDIKATLATNIVKQAAKAPTNGKDFQKEAVKAVKAGKEKEIKQTVKAPNQKMYKAMVAAITESFGDGEQVVKTYARYIMPRQVGEAKVAQRDELIEAYELGRVSMQAEMLGYTLDDLPGLIKEGKE